MVDTRRAAGNAGVPLRLVSVDERLQMLLDRTNLFRVLREVPVPTPALWDDAPPTAVDAAVAEQLTRNRRD